MVAVSEWLIWTLGNWDVWLFRPVPPGFLDSLAVAVDRSGRRSRLGADRNRLCFCKGRILGYNIPLDPLRRDLYALGAGCKSLELREISPGLCCRWEVCDRADLHIRLSASSPHAMVDGFLHPRTTWMNGKQLIKQSLYPDIFSAKQD